MTADVPTWFDLLGELNNDEGLGLETNLRIAKALGVVPVYARLDAEFPRDPETGLAQWDNGVPVLEIDRGPDDPPYEGGFLDEYVKDPKAALRVVPGNTPLTIEVSGDRRQMAATVAYLGKRLTGKPTDGNLALAICRAGVLARTVG